MKKLLLATTAVLLAAPAFAADLPRRSPAIAPAPVFVQAGDWTGFYVGLNVGYFAAKELGDATANIKPDGFTVGARVGYDWQVGGSWVVGILGDIDASFAKDDISTNNMELKIPLIASANLRVGYLITPATLLYATGGFTYADINTTLSALVPAGTPDSAMGWNVGAGIEHRLTQNWSVFGEYRYTSLRLSDPVVAFPSIGRDADAHVFKLGVNYRFGGSSRPVVARY